MGSEPRYKPWPAAALQFLLSRIMTVASSAKCDYTAPMKHIIKSFLFVLISSSLATSLASAQNSLTEDYAIEIMTPYAKQMGLKGINLTRSEEYADNLGSSEVRNGYIEIEYGTDVRIKYPTMKEDTFTFILCHELGHTFARKSMLREDGSRISPEGYSDYWSAAVCLKKIFSAIPSREVVTPDPFVQLKCDSVYKTNIDRIVCYRIAAAGMDFGTQMHLFVKSLSPADTQTGFYAKPDYKKKETIFFDNYPSLQCRMETALAGALCPTSEKRWTMGIANWACETGAGARPSCWYK